MSTKRLFFWAIAAIAVSLSFTSCEEHVESTCWIEYVEGSVNYRANIYLQIKTSQEVNYNENDSETYYFGTDEGAINWFNQKMDYLESETFAAASPEVPVLDESKATFKLVSAYSGDMNVSGTRDLATRTVTFAEHHISLPDSGN